MRALVFTLAVVASTTAVAVEPTDYLERIVVTASRSPRALADVASTATVIDRAEIERSRTTFVADLLRRVPGLAVTSNGGIGKKTEIRLRGAESNHVLVLIDGIEANDLATVDEFDFANLVTDNIERIEIVRGPHSSLWGSEAVAGVINIVTRAPGESFSADVSLEGGSFATTRIAAGAGGRGEGYGLRVAVSHTDSGGTNASQVGDEDDAYHQQTIDIKGHVDLGSTLRLDSSVRHTSADSQTDSFDFLTSRPFDTPGISDTDQTYAQAVLTHQAWQDRWTQKLAGRWTSTENDTFDPVGFIDGDLSGDKYAINYQSNFRLASPWPVLDAHELTLAIDHEIQEYADHAFERELDVTGYVLEHNSRWFGALALGGSVRYDRNSDFKDVLTYRVSGAYELPLQLGRLSLVRATGQKAPLFTERFGFSPSPFFTFVGNPGLKPEKSRSWEVAWRRRFQPLDALFELAWFDERTRREINGFFSATPGVFTAINLPGTTVRRGLESSLRVDLGHGMDADLSYTHVDASDVLDGPRLDKVRVPRHQGHLGLRYRLSGLPADLNLDLDYSGHRDDFDFSVFPRSRVALPERLLLNLGGGYDLAPRVRLFARVENLLDDRDEEVLGFLQPGIAGYLGLRIVTAP